MPDWPDKIRALENWWVRFRRRGEIKFKQRKAVIIYAGHTKKHLIPHPVNIHLVGPVKQPRRGTSTIHRITVEEGIHPFHPCRCGIHTEQGDAVIIMAGESQILLPFKGQMLCVGRIVEGEISIIGNHCLHALVAWIISLQRDL